MLGEEGYGGRCMKGILVATKLMSAAMLVACGSRDEAPTPKIDRELGEYITRLKSGTGISK